MSQPEPQTQLSQSTNVAMLDRQAIHGLAGINKMTIARCKEELRELNVPESQYKKLKLQPIRDLLVSKKLSTMGIHHGPVPTPQPTSKGATSKGAASKGAASKGATSKVNSEVSLFANPTAISTPLPIMTRTVDLRQHLIAATEDAEIAGGSANGSERSMEKAMERERVEVVAQEEEEDSEAEGDEDDVPVVDAQIDVYRDYEEHVNEENDVNTESQAGWKKERPTDPSLLPKPFTKQNRSIQLTKKLSHEGRKTLQPYEVFEWFWDVELKRKIVGFTNANARRKEAEEVAAADIALATEEQNQTSKGKEQATSQDSWNTLTVSEFDVFIGILMYMALVKLRSVDLYWSEDPVYDRGFKKMCRMSRNRFQQIIRYLHFTDEANQPPRNERSKTYKVDPILTYLCAKFMSLVELGEDVSVDEMMIPNKAPLSLNQYMPLKPIKRGIKSWAVSCARTGYVWRLEIYSGKNTGGGESEGGLGGSVVLRMTEGLQGKWRRVHADNYFTSVELAIELLYRKTYLRGTTRDHRKSFPKSVKVTTKDGVGTHKYAMSVINNLVCMA